MRLWKRAHQIQTIESWVAKSPQLVCIKGKVLKNAFAAVGKG